LIAVVAEMRGRDLAARVTVDARVVNENEEVARDVLRQSPRPVSHARLYNSRNVCREFELTLLPLIGHWHKSSLSLIKSIRVCY
jgi:hypothetical protein